MNTQPEALRLAERIDCRLFSCDDCERKQAAAELRRLHQECEASMKFRLRVARMLAELHGEEILSEQQCARYMGIDLVSWRRIERTFSAGACFVEGEAAALPENAEAILSAALSARTQEQSNV